MTMVSSSSSSSSVDAGHATSCMQHPHNPKHHDNIVHSINGTQHHEESANSTTQNGVTSAVSRINAATSALEKQLRSNPLYGKYVGQHILSVTQFQRHDVDNILAIASYMRQMVQDYGTCRLLEDKLLSTIFYEASTRTSSSFQAAMLRLGGKVLPISDVSNSSVSKGETLTDTMHCLESYSDVIVLRHPKIGAAHEASSVLSIPLLNAGDGAGEHPTQALLDLFTIQSELNNTIDGLTITMIGDLKNGRTVHSLSKLLKHYKVSINYVSPVFLRMPSDIINDLTNIGIHVHETEDLTSVLPNTDILYVTRIQKERFTDMGEYQTACNAYCITPELLELAKPTLRILHPLPRVSEIDVRVDSDPRAAYFRQMKSGLCVRMALLACVLGRA